LLHAQGTIINAKFDYVFLFIGTLAIENKTLTDICLHGCNVNIFELKKLFPKEKEF